MRQTYPRQECSLRQIKRVGSTILHLYLELFPTGYLSTVMYDPKLEKPKTQKPGNLASFILKHGRLNTA